MINKGVSLLESGEFICIFACVMLKTSANCVDFLLHFMSSKYLQNHCHLSSYSAQRELLVGGRVTFRDQTFGLIIILKDHFLLFL